MSDALLDEIKIEKQEMRNRPFRQGDYGYHHTVVGKIVYQRPKHYFTRADWERIGKKYLLPLVEENDATMPQAPWWMRVLREYTLMMMDEIFDKIPFVKAIGVEPENWYNEIQLASTEMGMRLYEALRYAGRYEEADLIWKAFRPYTYGESVTRP